jgi:DnaK suppressor protein
VVNTEKRIFKNYDSILIETSKSMSSQEREELKEKILENMAKVDEEIRLLEDMTRPIAPENAVGRVSRMDVIGNKGVSESALRSVRKKLANLQIALRKVALPEFGVCNNCGKPIQPARLMYMPESTRCVACADK